MYEIECKAKKYSWIPSLKTRASVTRPTIFPFAAKKKKKKMKTVSN